jgi:hypothetical protein
MPCRKCGESAMEKHNGVCYKLSYDEAGNASYWCLDCVIEELEDD